jgi:SP family myo-inositol transporter-like MFS transporter 13
VDDAGGDGDSDSATSWTSLRKLKPIPYKASFVWVLCFVGSIGGFLFGYDTGIIAGA